MKSKLKLIIWPVIYLVLIINVCISFIFVFRSFYYRSIFVSGSSMEPTLNGNTADRVDYGLIDDHDYAIKNLKRFQILTTYYPFADSKDYVGGYSRDKVNVIDTNEASYKIKRVYGFPGETIKFVVDEEKANIAKSFINPYCEEAQFYCKEAIQFEVKGPNENDEFVRQSLKFKRKINPDKIMTYQNFEYHLEEEEYWVMGDNYSASSDCFNKKHPIYRDNIVGVLISIEGTCKIISNTEVDPTDDGTKISYKCTKKKRHWPTYY